MPDCKKHYHEAVEVLEPLGHAVIASINHQAAYDRYCAGVSFPRNQEYADQDDHRDY